MYKTLDKMEAEEIFLEKKSPSLGKGTSLCNVDQIIQYWETTVSFQKHIKVPNSQNSRTLWDSWCAEEQKSCNPY